MAGPVPSSIDKWLRTRRGGYFVIVLGVFLIVGTIVTALALVLADSSGSNRLAIAGTFASGVASFFGLAGVSSALIANYVSQNKETRDAEEAWTAKLRLEEALTTYVALVAEGVRTYRELHPEDRSFSKVGFSPLIQGGLRQLADALASARKAGLIRILSLVSQEQNRSKADLEEKYDLGVTLAVIEAHVVNDIATRNPGVGQATLLEAHDLLKALSNLEYDSMASMWDTKSWELPAKAMETCSKYWPNDPDVSSNP